MKFDRQRFFAYQSIFKKLCKEYDADRVAFTLDWALEHSDMYSPNYLPYLMDKVEPIYEKHLSVTHDNKTQKLPDIQLKAAKESKLNQGVVKSLDADIDGLF